METRLRQLCEQAIMQERAVLGPDPSWHFLFLEDPETIQTLQQFFPREKQEEGIIDVLAAFADPKSASSACDACAALSRAASAAGEAGSDCRFSEPFTLFFNKRDIGELKKAFGVPGQYVCTGALVFTAKSPEKPVHPLSWDVFSYMMEAGKPEFRHED